MVVTQLLTLLAPRSDCSFSPPAAKNSLQISYENLVLDQDYNFYLMSLSILITCMLDHVWMLSGDLTC